MGCTCGEPNGSELTPIGVGLNGPRGVRLMSIPLAQWSAVRPGHPNLEQHGISGSVGHAQFFPRVHPEGGHVPPGMGSEPALPLPELEGDGGDGLLAKKSGKIFRVGIFLDFVWLTTRTPHGAYARRARRNRIDPHGGGMERLTTRTWRGVAAGSGASCTPRSWGRSPAHETEGNVFRVGIFLDFVWRPGTTCTPHGGASYVRGAKRNRIDPHRGDVERLVTRTIVSTIQRW